MSIIIIIVIISFPTKYSTENMNIIIPFDSEPLQPATTGDELETVMIAHSCTAVQHPQEPLQSATGDTYEIPCSADMSVQHPQDDSETLVAIVTSNATHVHRAEKSTSKKTFPVKETGPNKPDALV